MKRASYLALACMAGVVYFAISVAVLHFLRPEYDPATRFISEFAVGPYGYLMTIAFFALGLGSLALSFGIAGVSPASRKSRTGTSLMGLWGAGVMVAGIFPADLTGSPETTSGSIHNAASIVSFLVLIAGAILFPLGMRRDARWQASRRLLLGLAFAVLAGFLVFIAMQGTAPGIGQRIFIALVLLWLLLTGVQLRRTAAVPSA